MKYNIIAYYAAASILAASCQPSNPMKGESLFLSSVESRTRQALNTETGSVSQYFIVPGDIGPIYVIDEKKICHPGKLDQVVNDAILSNTPVQFSGRLSDDRKRIILTDCPYLLKEKK